MRVVHKTEKKKTKGNYHWPRKGRKSMRFIKPLIEVKCPETKLLSDWMQLNEKARGERHAGFGITRICHNCERFYFSYYCSDNLCGNCRK